MSLKFQVSHIRGSQNFIADTLSRMFDGSAFNEEESISCSGLLTDFPLTFSDLQQHQVADPAISDIIQSVKNATCDPKFF